MSLSLEQVRRIAALARIEISPAEAETTRDQLNGIFRFIEQMQAVDTTGVTPMAHAQDASVFPGACARADVARWVKRRLSPLARGFQQGNWGGQLRFAPSGCYRSGRMGRQR